MAEYILSFDEMIEKAKKEGRYHEGGRISNYPKTHEEYLQKILEMKMRINRGRKPSAFKVGSLA